MAFDPFEQRPEFQDALYDLELVRDLLGGTKAMRGTRPSTPIHEHAAQSLMYGDSGGTLRGSTPWLPTFPSDSSASYFLRWTRAFCIGTFADTVKRITSKPFAEPLAVRGGEGTIVDVVRKNADRAGTSLHRVKRLQYEHKLAFGGAYTLIALPGAGDLPDDAFVPGTEDVSAVGASRYDVRPFYVPVHPLNVPAWEFAGDGPSRKLVELRIRDDRVERVSDQWERIERVHIYSLSGSSCTVRTYSRKQNGKAEEGSVLTLNMPFIPFVADLAIDSGDYSVEMIASSPLRDLAWLALQHFQETAEQGVALLAARAEAPVERGADPEEAKKPLAFGIGRAKRTTSSPEDYDLKYVGPSGRGVELGEKSLERIEERMARLAAQPLERRTGTQTARGQAMNENKAESIAEALARTMEDATEREMRMIDFMARPNDGPLDSRLPDIEVDIFADFGFSLGDSLERGRFLLELHKAGVYPTKTLLEDMQGLKLISDRVEVDELIEMSATEAADALSRQIEAMERASAVGGQQEQDEPEEAESGEPAPAVA